MRICALFLSLLLATAGAQAVAQQTKNDSSERAALHQSVDWQLLSSHLPDPATASAAQLEVAGDVLMARRFPEDALDYYQYALQRGTDTEKILKKMGVVHLEMQQNVLAHTLFKRCTQMDKKDSQAWNNLGAADYSMGYYHSAIDEYKKALKLDKSSAIFHANLGMAYFSNHDIDNAKTQFEIAVKMDPEIMSRDYGGGMTLHVLQVTDYGKLCFEMAKMYASLGRMAETKLWLQKAAEHGLDLHRALSEDAEMHVWLKNPEIQVIMMNAEKLNRHVPVGPLPALS